VNAGATCGYGTREFGHPARTNRFSAYWIRLKECAHAVIPPARSVSRRFMRDDEPRQHHYEFAHVVLRAIVFRAGRLMLDLAANGGLTALVHESWDRVGEGLPEERRLPSDGLRGERIDTPDLSAAVIILPPAEHIAEAHLVALVSDPADAERIDFFTLERTWTSDGEPATALGQWTRDGRHLNLGDGPDPEPRAFLDALARVYAIGG